MEKAKEECVEAGDTIPTALLEAERVTAASL